MIYTCYEMIRDCRADRPEGWSYFVANYVPVISKLLAHYSGGAVPVEGVLAGLRRPESSLFQPLEPAPERWFVAQLRQQVVGSLPVEKAAIELALETVAAALEPLTLVEKQAVWLESMRYAADRTGVLLRMAPQTAEKIRARGAELLRGKSDAWNRTVLADNGFSLGRAAAALAGSECLPPKTFLDMLDGRTTWSGRGELERHVTRCWHCIDHFCRLVEVVELLRDNRPLSDEESGPYRELLGVKTATRPAWKRWLTGRA
jgi:hypothetical protein